MEVDLPRKRIALSMRLDDVPGEARSGRPAQREDAPAGGGGGGNRRGGQGGGASRPSQQPKPAAAPANSAFADAFSRALKK
jgi:uncharacterized protein